MGIFSEFPNPAKDQSVKDVLNQRLVILAKVHESPTLAGQLMHRRIAGKLAKIGLKGLTSKTINSIKDVRFSKP